MYENAEHITQDYGFHWRKGEGGDQGGAKEGCTVRFFFFLNLSFFLIF